MIDTEKNRQPVLLTVENENLNASASQGIQKAQNLSPLVLILVGKCGSGKSSTANTLTGATRFETMRSASSVTLGCQTSILAAPEVVKEKFSEIIILDTPGLGDPEIERTDTLDEIKRGVDRLRNSYPHAKFALVLVLGIHSRVVEDDLRDIGLLGTIFGLKFYRHSVLLWTHGDLLLEGGIEDYLSRAGPALKSFLEDVAGGQVVVQNNTSNRDSKVNPIFEELVSKSALVSGRGDDLELKGKRARRARQAEIMRKARASGVDNRPLLAPLMDTIVNFFKSLIVGSDSSESNQSVENEPSIV